jgi:hypothetical protein
MKEEVFIESIRDITDKIDRVDLDIQKLIVSSNGSKIKDRKEEILNLIMRMAGAAEWLSEALEDPKQIQTVTYEK